MTCTCTCSVSVSLLTSLVHGSSSDGRRAVEVLINLFVGQRVDKDKGFILLDQAYALSRRNGIAHGRLEGAAFRISIELQLAAKAKENITIGVG